MNYHIYAIIILACDLAILASITYALAWKLRAHRKAHEYERTILDNMIRGNISLIAERDSLIKQIIDLGGNPEAVVRVVADAEPVIINIKP